ncbi:hypothetical protein Q9L58_005802 [Maublancomyces gigas]|uniref:Uncharacterized protein n=1 Tax=Discina gigas TaxID=1032678 RepID=A0ABR3GH97_9PEZI
MSSTDLDTPSSSPASNTDTPHARTTPICVAHHAPIPKPPTKISKFLTYWLNSPEIHGYEFDENVLSGIEPDTDWTGGYINQPNSWKEVAKCLQSEIEAQKLLKESSMFRDEVDFDYWEGCKLALEEVVRFHL